MADTDVSTCRCSNISIMQLFHELKQRFPNVPDQIVSKVIQQNFHDKNTCETLLERENIFYSPQTYPGALIAGDPRIRIPETLAPDHCPLQSAPEPAQITSPESSSNDESLHFNPAEIPQTHAPIEPTSNRPQALSLEERLELCKLPLGKLVREAQERVARRLSETAEGCDRKEEKTPSKSPPSSFRNSKASSVPNVPVPQSHSSPKPVRPSSLSFGNSEPKRDHLESQTRRNRTETNEERNSLAPPPVVHLPFASLPSKVSSTSSSDGKPSPNEKTATPKEYEVAVECVVTPSTPGDQQRSFTSVNLTLRPPSAETTLPIDITSGQSLTYTSASYDPRQGYQSSLQIRIGAALLQQQRERKDLLARELRRKKERLRFMQTQVQSMKLALAKYATTPLLLSKMKSDIEQLRGECERLTAAVDAFSQQNISENLPLGETDEDFYRNIYTGQRQQRAGWSCRVCTFRNHPLLTVCEECEMPRLPLGTSPVSHRVLSHPHPSVISNNNPPCSVGETSTSASRTITPLQDQ